MKSIALLCVFVAQVVRIARGHTMGICFSTPSGQGTGITNTGRVFLLTYNHDSNGYGGDLFLQRTNPTEGEIQKSSISGSSCTPGSGATLLDRMRAGGCFSDNSVNANIFTCFYEKGELAFNL